MVDFKLKIALLIGVLHVSTAYPIIPGIYDPDATKLFSPDELQRARNAGITDHSLIAGTSFGLTIDEMVKLHPLKGASDISQGNVTFGFADKICKVLDPMHETAVNFTSGHEIHLNGLIESVLKDLPNVDHALFTRTTICAYISQPDVHEKDASSFGLNVVPYMDIRFLKMKAQNATRSERVKLTKEMCCVIEGRVNNPGFLLDRKNFSGQSNEELDEFRQHWNQFEAENTSMALRNICDSLHAKNPSQECRRGSRVDEERSLVR